MIKPATNHSLVEFYVHDLGLAKDFYQKLGFQIVWEIDSFVVLKLDQNIVTFFRGPNLHFDKYPSSALRGLGVEVVINVESEPISSYFEKVKKIYPKNIIETLTHLDPFGLYLRFTEPENILYP